MTRTSTTSISVASVEAIRARFPALARRYEELPVAYFDGPGGTQVPDLVVVRMTDYLLHHNANTHWHFPTSLETDAALDAARRALADFLNASPKEIAFGNNMTTITFHVARALGREWGTGDEIVVTELDHHANIAPWRALARERGVTVRTVKMRVEGQVDWEDFERVVGPQTRLVALTHAANVLGKFKSKEEYRYSLSGGLNVKSASGDARAREIAGGVNIQTASGDVELDRRREVVREAVAHQALAEDRRRGHGPVARR